MTPAQLRPLLVGLIVVFIAASCGTTEDQASESASAAEAPANAVSVETVSIDTVSVDSLPFKTTPETTVPSKTAATNRESAEPVEVVSDLDRLAADQNIGVIVATAITGSITAYEYPNGGAAVTTLSNPTAIGGPLVFQLTGSDVEEMEGEEWAEVYLPIRPNGATGWIRLADVSLSSNTFRIEIDRATHRMQVFEGSKTLIDTSVAIGTGATPTPVGQFYIIELLQPDRADGPYGPFAFGLSGFSEALPNFAGGDGVIGVHGTNNPSALGQDVSHGCVRVSNDVIELMVTMIPLGTPVTIV
ncbi:MAG: L,D-transpeptidase [Acidimicrobiales bacterium]